jgi:hypothetical protein
MNIKRSLVGVVLLSIILVSLSAASATEEVTATLKANIEEYLEHGVTSGEDKYQSSLDLENAFTTDPQFVYGYRSNAVGTFDFTMTVGDFINQTDNDYSVKIATVRSTSDLSYSTTDGYTVFTYTYISGASADEATLTISPAKISGGYDHTGVLVADGESVATAPAGDYESTITFVVTVRS